MRPNRRAAIVQVAKRHLAEHGKDGLRLEQVADAVGMSAQGLRYHFRSNHDLAEAVGESVAAEWAGALERTIGKPMRHATPAERTRAYVAVLLTGDLDVYDHLILIHLGMAAELNEPWIRRVQPWVELPAHLEESARNRLLHAQLLAEGLSARFASGIDRDTPSCAAMSSLVLALTRT